MDDNEWAAKVAGDLGKRLAEWPTTHQLFGELGKVLPPVGNKAKAQKKQHCFSYVDGQIRCSVCNFHPRKGEASHKECEGYPKAIVDHPSFSFFCFDVTSTKLLSSGSTSLSISEIMNTYV